MDSVTRGDGWPTPVFGQRKRGGWTLLVAACILAVAGREAAAQRGGSHAPPRSTLRGVYTAEQAARGEEVYAAMCTGCHTAASHTGETFKKFWAGRPVWDLFEYVRDRMPKNDPGSLSEDEYVAVVAYLLKMNEMPSGRSALSSDSTMLKSIQIAPRSKRASPARNSSARVRKGDGAR
jgi:mono/diheme cytochrome c family protein